MHRFYSPKSDFSSDKTIITDRDEIHHLKNVLRLKKGQTISIFNNKCQEAIAKIILLNPTSVEVEIKSIVSAQDGKNIYLILACATPKKSKFETIIEKCTELGVNEIIPLQTSRTEMNIKDPQRINKKLERYKTVAVNASKQSKRCTIPTIHQIMSLASAIKYADEVHATKIIPALKGERNNLLSILANVKNNKKIIFFIGPEGDFTDKEYNLANKNNCLPVSLGKTVLKVETAAISVISFTNLYFLQKQ